MNRFEPKTFRHSVRYAVEGLRYIWQHEQNFRTQVTVGAIALLAGLLLGLTREAWIVLILTAGTVLILEILNTTLERLTDLAQPRLHHYAKAMKDMMAAAVLLASLGALVIGVLIFWPYVFGGT